MTVERACSAPPALFGWDAMAKCFDWQVSGSVRCKSRCSRFRRNKEKEEQEAAGARSARSDTANVLNARQYRILTPDLAAARRSSSGPGLVATGEVRYNGRRFFYKPELATRLGPSLKPRSGHERILLPSIINRNISIIFVQLLNLLKKSQIQCNREQPRWTCIGPFSSFPGYFLKRKPERASHDPKIQDISRKHSCLLGHGCGTQRSEFHTPKPGGPATAA